MKTRHYLYAYALLIWYFPTPMHCLAYLMPSSSPHHSSNSAFSKTKLIMATTLLMAGMLVYSRYYRTHRPRRRSLTTSSTNTPPPVNRAAATTTQAAVEEQVYDLDNPDNSFTKLLLNFKEPVPQPNQKRYKKIVETLHDDVLIPDLTELAAEYAHEVYFFSKDSSWVLPSYVSPDYVIYADPKHGIRPESRSQRNPFSLYHIPSQRTIYDISSWREYIFSPVAISPDQKLIAYTEKQDVRIKELSHDDGFKLLDSVQERSCLSKDIQDLRFHYTNTNKSLLLLYNDTMRVWDLNTQQESHVYHFDFIHTTPPDTRRLLILDEKTILVICNISSRPVAAYIMRLPNMDIIKRIRYKELFNNGDELARIQVLDNNRLALYNQKLNNIKIVKFSPDYQSIVEQNIIKTPAFNNFQGPFALLSQNGDCILAQADEYTYQTQEY